jgi:hypothetical protein
MNDRYRSIVIIDFALFMNGRLLANVVLFCDCYIVDGQNREKFGLCDWSTSVVLWLLYLEKENEAQLEHVLPMGLYVTPRVTKTINKFIKPQLRCNTRTKQVTEV